MTFLFQMLLNLPTTSNKKETPLIDNNSETVKHDLHPMLEKLQVLAKENDLYALLGVSPDHRTRQDLEVARRAKVRQLSSENATNTEEENQFSICLAKLNSIWMNYFCSDELKQVYDIIDQYRKLYSEIATTDYSNLLEFHDRVTKIQQHLKQVQQSFSKDFSLISPELTLLSSILEKALKNINPSWTSPQEKSSLEEGSQRMKDALLLALILKMHQK